MRKTGLHGEGEGWALDHTSGLVERPAVRWQQGVWGPGVGGGSGKGESSLQDELKVGATCTGLRGPRKVNNCPGHSACTPEGYAIYHRGCGKMDP